MADSVLAYTTTTGDTPELEPAWVDEPYCFVCRRNTDHFAEHDDLVEAGLAEYASNGSVYEIVSKGGAASAPLEAG